MKKFLFYTFFAFAVITANAQSVFKANYEGGINAYCGAQGSGFYETIGGHIGTASYHEASKSLRFTYDPAGYTGVGWFGFGMPLEGNCRALGRDFDMGIDMSVHKKVRVKIKASNPVDLGFYLGSAAAGSWVTESSTYSFKTPETNFASIPKNIHVTTSYQIFEIDFAANPEFDNWELRNKVNTFGFEFLSNTNDTVYVAFVNLNDSTTNISFEPLLVKTYGDADFYLNATGVYNLPVSYSSTNTNVATIVDNKVHIVGAGQTIINAFLTEAPGNIVPQTLIVNKAAQTINFTKLNNDSTDTFPYTLSLNSFSSSGLPVTYTLLSGNASINGNIVTVNNAGIITIKAAQNGNENWLAATSITQEFVIFNKNSITKNQQTITTIAIGDRITNAFPAVIQLNATSSSNLPITYALEFGNGTISGNTLTVNGPGYFTVAYHQFGDSNWNPASKTTDTFTVAKIDSLTDFVNNDVSFAANYYQGPLGYCGAQGVGFYEATGGGIGISNYNATEKALQFSYDNQYPGGVGWFGFALAQNGEIPAYTTCRAMGREENAGINMSINKKVTIQMKASEPVDINFYLGSAVQGAWSPSTSTYNTNIGEGLSITPKLHLTTEYQIFTIDYADSAKFTTWAAKNKVNVFGFELTGPTNALISLRFVRINERASKIRFASLEPKTLDSPDFPLTATVSSGLIPTYTSSNPNVATVTNGQVHLVGVGSTIITASQAGNVDFDPAQSVSQILVVTKGKQELELEPIVVDSVLSYPRNITLKGVSNSGLPLVYSVTGNAVITDDVLRTENTSGSTDKILKITGSGKITITVSQPGNTNWNAAKPDTIHIVALTKYSASRNNQSITTPNIADKTVNSYPVSFSLNATSTSNLPVTYLVESGNATIEDNIITLYGPGSVTVSMQQCGDNNWNTSEKAIRSFRTSNTTAIVELVVNNITYLYPNPSNGTLFINSSEEITSVILINTLGEQEEFQGKSQITTSLKGLVIARVFTTKGTYTQKLIIE